MARPGFTKHEKQQEGAKLRAAITAYGTKKGCKITQGEVAEMLSNSLSLSADDTLTQGLISQWYTGKTRIEDKKLACLGALFDFNPIEVRPSMALYAENLSGHEVSKTQQLIAKALNRDPSTISSAQATQAYAVLLALFSEDT